MAEAWRFYKDLLDDAGEPNPTTDGNLECLAIMQSGKAAMFYDATVNAGWLENRDSKVAGRIGYAFAPSARRSNTGWLWAWALGIESSSKHPEEAFRFITWVTDRKYISLVGTRRAGTRSRRGPGPPRTAILITLPRRRLPAIVLHSIQDADYDHPTLRPVPYKGVQYVSIPEFQSLGEAVSQQLAAYIAGQKPLDQALADSQAAALKVAREGGYLK